MPQARNARTSASGPLLTAIACLAPVHLAIARSSSATLRPCEYLPRSTISSTCALITGHSSSKLRACEKNGTGDRSVVADALLMPSDPPAVTTGRTDPAGGKLVTGAGAAQ